MIGMVTESSPDADEEISLPEELLGDILLSMPARRVFELRCLSKYYRDLINNPKFFNEYYDRLNKKNPSIILIEKNGNSPFKTDLLIQFDLTRSAATVHSLSENPIFDEELDGNIIITLVGCCRGILCYHVEEYNHIHLAFWNPFTGASRRGCAYPIFDEEIKIRRLFGYDAVTDDLKLVLVKRSTTLENHVRYSSVVYSSKMDSWKRTGEELNDLELDMGWNSFSGVFVEGTNCVHTFVSDKFSYRKILAFDFGAERFNLVPIPESLRSSKRRIGRTRFHITHKNLGLLSLDSCLGLLHEPKYGCFDVWKMKEYGVEKSWTRQYSFSQSLNMVPSTFMNDGCQLLMLSDHFDEMGLYSCNSEGGEGEELVDFRSRYSKVDLEFSGFDVKPQINKNKFDHFIISPCLREP